MTISLTDQLAGQLLGKHIGPQPIEAYDKPMNLVFASNGVFRVAKTPVALFKSKIADIPATAGIPGVGRMEEGPELLIPKIPLKYLIQVLSFYRDVHKKDGTEASTLFFWNHNNVKLPTHYVPTAAQTRLNQPGDEVKGLSEDGQLVIYCPQQVNSGSLSEFHEDGMVNYLREHCQGLCEIHSHHTMDAFWSGTDNANENATQFYGVWGKINDEKPKFLFRWVAGDKKVNVDPSVLFDIPQVKITTTVTREVPVQGFEPIVTSQTKYETYQGPWENLEYPSDWMGQHEKKKYTAPAGRSWAGYQGGSTTGYQGNNYRSGQYQGTGYQGNSYQYQGGEDLPPSGHYDEFAGHDDFRGSSATSKSYQQSAAVTSTSSWKDQKKNGISGINETKVEVFVDDPDLMPTEVTQLREHIEFICEELIQDGYDQIISSGLTDTSSFDDLHEDEQLT